MYYYFFLMFILGEKEKEEKKGKEREEENDHISQWVEKFEMQYKKPFHILQSKIDEFSNDVNDIQEKICIKEQELMSLCQKKKEILGNMSLLQKNTHLLKKKCVQDIESYLRNNNVKALVCEEYHFKNIILKIHTPNKTYLIHV